MAYATYEDVEARWRALSDSERARADTLLGDAAVIIDALTTPEPEDEGWLAKARYVSCSMVVRAMLASASSAFGVSEQTIKADIYSQSLSFANPNGDLYLTAMERRLLGASTSYATSMRPVVAPVEVRRRDIW